MDSDNYGIGKKGNVATMMDIGKNMLEVDASVYSLGKLLLLQPVICQALLTVLH